MYNIIYDDEIYKRVFKDNNDILKYSFQGINAWEDLMYKNLPFLNIPTSCAHLSKEEQIKYPECVSKIRVPFLEGYSTLYNNNFINKFSTKDTLILMKKMLMCTKVMHDNNVYHGDLFSKNIMINKNLDFNFIDLDAAIINNNVSEENTYYLDEIPLSKKVEKTMIDDKLSIFNLILYYLVNKNFNADISYRIDIDELALPKYVLDEINSYVISKIPDNDYYFIDIIDELLSLNYDSNNLSKTYCKR